MKRKWLWAAAAIIMSLVLFSQAGWADPPSKTQLRTDAAQKRFTELLVQHPDDEIRALVSFSQNVAADQALQWAEAHKLAPMALYHAYALPRNTFRGGYFVVPGESRAESVRRYQERYRSVLEGQAESIQRFIESSPTTEKGDLLPDQRRVAQLHATLEDLQAQLRDFEVNGIPVYGMEVLGTPTRLQSLRSSVQQVRLVEALAKEQSSVPLLPRDR